MNKFLNSLFKDYQGSLKYLNRGKEFYCGNLIKLLTCSKCIFDEMLCEIKKARYKVWLESYIYKLDSVGEQFRIALIEASRRGCEVTLLCDALGSWFITKNFVRTLEDAGVRFIFYNSFEHLNRPFKSLFLRNHRKLLIVDGRVVFCGSANIIDCSVKKKPFQDAVVKMIGPVCFGAEENVYNTYYKVLDTEVCHKAPRLTSYRNGKIICLYECNRAFKLYSLPDLLMKTLQFSKKYCYFITPYFDPSENIKLFLLEAAKRGVKIRILTAGISDVPFMHMASQCLYEDYIRAGVEIYETYDCIVHSKVFISDDKLMLIGSFNLDRISLHNLELSFGIFDHKNRIEKELEYFYKILKKSVRIDIKRLQNRSLRERILSKICFYILRGVQKYIY
ncbi:MAG: phosphatidylserine/phosphatidylglycerophosphate/cardiolipin synthase family protein [Deltaproteobacteria bacterium]|nr:MAG: phosphatidylserine/phosphatidylglycerophosphate/cardiolipin synthase family protein [Deltaproteobacteria bacterium]